jgi:hypothetical protein
MAFLDAPGTRRRSDRDQEDQRRGRRLGPSAAAQYLNTQLDPQQTKQDAAKLVSQGVDIGW